MDPCDDAEFPWDVEDKASAHVAAKRVCDLADKEETADRAIALCMMMGADIQNVQSNNVYRVFYRGVVYGQWLYPARAAVAFCIAMNLDIEI